MKQLLVFILLAYSCTICSQNIYVSNTGNDAGLGTIGSPYRTIAKVNAIAGANAVVFLDKGSIWNETVQPKANNISYKYYGTGAKPKISGYTNVSSWTLVSTGIYSASVNAKYNSNLLTIDGVPQAIGRWPNADSVNGGFLIYNYIGNTQITNSLFAANNWVGSTVCIRKEGYILERDSVTSQSLGSLNYVGRQTNNPAGGGITVHTPGSAGYGAFLENSILTLDRFGEWYFNKSSNTLNVFFGANNPNSYVTKIATIDTLANINSRTGISFDGIAFEGSNGFSICGINANTVTIINCDMDGCGGNSIHLWNAPNVTINSNNIRNSMNAGIVAWATNQTGITIKYNNVQQTAVFPGNSGFYTDADRTAIYANYKGTGLVRHNRIDTTGYKVIQFQGSNVVVDSNYINYYCFVTDDGGGIYTYQRVADTNRVVKDNIVIYGIGAPYGNSGNGTHAEGIYLDGSASNVYTYNNTVAYVINRGLYSNDPVNNIFRNNTCYMTFGWASSQHDYGSISGYRNVGNIYFYSAKPVNNDQNYFNNGINNPATTPFAATIQSALNQMGVIDSNYYHIKTDNVFFWYWAFYTTPSSFTYVRNNTLAFWQSYSGKDANSKRVPITDITNQFFAYNDSDDLINVSLDGVYKDVYGNTYTGSVDIQPFKSVVLLKQGALPPSNSYRLMIRLK